MAAAFRAKIAMPPRQTLVYNIPRLGDAQLGTEDEDCWLAFALWQGAAVAFRAHVPACEGVGIRCTAT